MTGEPYIHKFYYRWEHTPSGTTGEGIWRGFSRAHFHGDLRHWNYLGQGIWVYRELDHEPAP